MVVVNFIEVAFGENAREPNYWIVSEKSFDAMYIFASLTANYYI